MKSVPPPAFQPLYQQIKALITKALSQGEWHAGEPLPSEADLAARYGVSQGTVRKALNDMAYQNVLVRQQGKGTFVASHVSEDRRYHFTCIASDRGGKTYPTPEILDFGRDKADAAAARKLGVASGALLYVIRRLMRVKGRPVVYDESRVPAALFKGLNVAVLTDQESMLYRTFEVAFGVRIVRAQERIKAVAADARVAAHLEMEVGTPLLRIERIAYTFDDKPVELRRSHCNTDAYHYRAKIN